MKTFYDRLRELTTENLKEHIRRQEHQIKIKQDDLKMMQEILQERENKK